MQQKQNQGSNNSSAHVNRHPLLNILSPHDEADKKPQVTLELAKEAVCGTTEHWFTYTCRSNILNKQGDMNVLYYFSVNHVLMHIDHIDLFQVWHLRQILVLALSRFR